MKILVAVRQVADPEVALYPALDRSGVELEGVRQVLDPCDAVALEAAALLSEAGVASEVVAVTVGPPEWEATLRSTLALGAQRAIRIAGEPEWEPLLIAKSLHRLAVRESPRLLLCGRRSADRAAAATPAMVAALLGWEQATAVSTLELASGADSCRVIREIDGGRLALQLSLPAVVSVDVRLNQPRYPSLPNIMKARRLPLAVVTPDELGVEVTPRTRRLGVELPPRRPPGVRVRSAREFLDQLQLRGVGPGDGST